MTKSRSVIDVCVIGLIIFLLIFLFTSCKHGPLTFIGDDEIIPAVIDTATNIGNTNTIPCNPDTVYFNNTILPLLVSNCAKSGCHDVATAKNGIILNSYAIWEKGDIHFGFNI